MHTTLTEEAQQFHAMKAKEAALKRLTHDWQPLAKIRMRDDAGNIEIPVAGIKTVKERDAEGWK